MSNLQVVPRDPEITQCLVCQTTLGHDSREAGYVLCHEHRKCTKCSLDLYPREVTLCITRLMEESAESEGVEVKDFTGTLNYSHLNVIHTRCEAIERASANPNPTLSIKQSEYDFLNLLRLMIHPDPELAILTNENNAMSHCERYIKDMSWDEQYIYLKKIEACVAVCSLAVAPGRKELKARIEEREKERYAKARKEAETSSRPAGKSVDATEELAIASYMKRMGTTSRDVAKKQMRVCEKAIDALMTIGASREIAEQSVEKDMIKRGVFKS